MKSVRYEKLGADAGCSFEQSQLATFACPICGDPRAQKIFLSRDRVHHLPGTFEIYRCVDCQAFFIQPWLSEDDLARYYPEQYGRYRRSRLLGKKNYRGWRRFVLENHYGYPSRKGYETAIVKKSAAYLLSLVSVKGLIPYRGAGRILDVGCGGGSYLHRLNQWGWETYGVEPSEVGAQEARSLGLSVFHGTLSEARFERSFFDVVRLSHVLEHLSEPKTTFCEINRILKTDGFVYLAVPNTRSLGFWLFQENWYGLDSPRHVISYCPKTLQALCERTGFEIVRLNFAAGPFNFVRSMKYYLEDKGKHWPVWIRQIDWSRSKLMRRTLKPFFFFVDMLGFGDILHATLRKK